MRTLGAKVAKILVYGFWLCGLTWAFFGPIAAFHHMVRFGATAYLVLDGETSHPGSVMWGGFQVLFFWERFAVGMILWAFSIFGTFKWLKFLDSKPEVM
jgi:hypothetical protein